MKYARWKYRFMHNRLREEGYKPVNMFHDREDVVEPIYVGLYTNGKIFVHIEDWIEQFEKFMKEKAN